MKEPLRTNDLILISKIKIILNVADIHYAIFDTHASIIEGSIDAIQKRILVSYADFKRSQKLIKDLTNDN